MVVRLSRRIVLGCGVVTLGFAPGSSSIRADQHGPELFVFRSPDSGHLVLAVAVPAVAVWRGGFDVVFHTGLKCWRVGGVRPLDNGVVAQRDGFQMFAGEVLPRGADDGARYTAVVLECPTVGERVSVWAEIFGEDGARFRVGSPFAANLLARDPALSGAYHAAFPEQDRGLFADALAGCIASVRGIGSPDVHARRLAGHLLPDVIRYCPERPVGFNFASQNGRHPADDAAAVVETLLSGAAVRRTAERPIPMTGRFPYFPRPVAAS